MSTKPGEGLSELESTDGLELARPRNRVAPEDVTAWQFAVRSTGVGVLDWDVASGRVVFSDRWLEMTGYSPEEVSTVDALVALVHPADLDMAMADVQKVLSGSLAAHDHQHRLRHKQGHWMWLRSRGIVTTRNERGEPVRMVGTHLDISALKLAEDARRASDVRFHELVNTVDGIVWEADATTFQFTFVSDRAERLLGYPKHAWIDQPTFWSDHIHPDDRDQAVNYCATRTAERRDHEFVYRMIAADGRVLWLHDVVTVVTHDDKPSMLRGIMVDITERRRADVQLRDEQERLKAILYTVGDPIFVTDNDHHIVVANRAFYSLIGALEESAIGTTLAEYVNDGERQQVLDIDRRVLDTGIAYEREDTLTLAGVTRTMLINRTRLIEASGRRLMVGSMRDLTALTLSAQAARQSDRFVTSVLEHLPYMVFVKAADDLRCVRLNRAGEHLLGLPRNDVIGKTPTELFDDATATALIAEDRQVLGGVPTVAHRSTVHTREHRERTLSTSKVAILSDSGSPEYLLAISEDITDRVRTEDALRTTTQRLEQALAASSTGIWEWNVETNDVFFSREWKQQIGYAEDEIRDAFDEWESRLHPEDRQRTVDYALAYVANPVGAFKMEFRLAHKDGSWRWIEARATFDPEPDGRRRRLLGSHVDVTDRKRSEEALRAVEAQLHQSQKMEAIGTLAGGIAHDFNNILGAILGSVYLAREMVGPDHPARSSLDQIHQSSQRAADLVEQLLAIGRPAPLERRALDLSRLLREDSALLRAALPAGVDFDLSLDGTAPPVQAHPTEIHQVLLNLVTNAWQALQGNAGRVSLALAGVDVGDHPLRLAGALAPGRYAQLTVTDTGKGMDATTVTRIFDPFFTTKEVGKGTGLGLTVVQRIVSGLKGAILVDSEPERGTTFAVYLPASATSRTSGLLPPASPEPAAATTARPTTASGGGQRVLVLDDEKALLGVTTRILERQGFRVNSFAEVAEALAAFHGAPDAFDLLIVDHNMPRASGLEVAREVAGASGLASCPGHWPRQRRRPRRGHLERREAGAPQALLQRCVARGH